MDIRINEDLIGGESDAEITAWLVAEGDLVADGDPVAELETSKVQLQIEAPTSGVIHLHVAAGSVVEVNTVIATISQVIT